MGWVMSSTQHFNNCLNKGLDFERNVATKILHQLYPNYWINNFAKDPTSKYGPRMFKGAELEEELVLPDFHLFHPEYMTMMWVDAKLKKQPYSDQTATRPGAQFLTLDTKSNQKYLKAMRELPGVLFLLYGIESTRNVYLARWNPEPETVEYNNQYGRGAAPIYYIDEMKLVGTF